MSDTNTKQNKIDFFRPSKKEKVRYTHLDTAFPESSSKQEEYIARFLRLNDNKDTVKKFWTPFDWFHNDAYVLKKHMEANSKLHKDPGLERTVIELCRREWERPNLNIPRSAWDQYRNTYYPLQRWREIGDVWLVKNDKSENGYALVLISAIKMINGVRYVEFFLCSDDPSVMTDEDFLLESYKHTSLGYDLVVHEYLEGVLFENDKKFMHKLGRVKQSDMQRIRVDDFEVYTHGKLLRAIDRDRVYKEFELGLLSKEVREWMEKGTILKDDEPKIEIVSGLEELKKKYDLIKKKGKEDISTREIFNPYAKHLWKMYSTFKENLLLTSDRDLGEKDQIILRNTDSKREVALDLEFYN